MRWVDSNLALHIHNHFPSTMCHLCNKKLRDIETYNSDTIAFLLVDKNTPIGEWTNNDA